ncbi:hypothetical protein [Micromonospora sp. NPDC005174]|uniref:hypothetical protein n=1 Tax=Micromonospora sp. NPDC005174 TaxID=3157018 RepID=UPI0033B04F74
MPLGISAELFDGNGFDGDAWFTIPEGRGGRRWPRPLGSAGRRMGEHPLEIGPTDASRTLMHLMQDDAVARWPYGFTRVYVLTPSPRWSLSNVVAETLQN